MSDNDDAKTDAQKLHKGDFSLHGVTRTGCHCGANPVKLVDVEERDWYKHELRLIHFFFVLQVNAPAP